MQYFKLFSVLTTFSILSTIFFIINSDRAKNIHSNFYRIESPFRFLGLIDNNCKNLTYELKGNLSIREQTGSSIRILKEIANENLNIQPGGYFSPRTCNSSDHPRDSVAIIIPYRDRIEHLLIFLRHMHPILTRQKLEYKIYVINQKNGAPFNRGKLINIGYKESMKERKWTCIIMHDVDHLPLNDKNLYTCGPHPRRLIVASSKYGFQYGGPYRNCFGGVTAMTPKQFENVNGFYNEYYGWGAEDDDLAQRIMNKKMGIDMLGQKEGMEIGRYQTIFHKQAPPGDDRFQKLQKAVSNMKSNGLNSLAYKVISIEHNKVYTNITVDLLYQKPQ